MSRLQIAVYAAIGICLLLLGIRAVREAGPDTQDAVAAAYALGGPDAAELLILEVMTTPGGFL